MSRPYIIMLRQLGGLGDALMCFGPVARGLKKKYGHSYDVHLVTCNKYLKGILPVLAKRIPEIDMIHTIDVDEWTTLPTMTAQSKKDAQDIMEHPVVQKSSGLVDLNNVCVYRENNDEKPKHRTLIWCEHAGVQPAHYRPEYKTTKKEKAAAKEVFRKWQFPGDKPIIGVALTAMDAARVLKPEIMLPLFPALVEAGYYPVALDAEVYMPGYPSIVGAEIPQLFSMIEQMDGFISHDSGLLHVAGTMGVPLVGIFGSIPQANRMLFYKGIALQSKLPCSPCFYKHSCLEDPNIEAHYACMASISVEQIVTTLKQLVPLQ